LVKLLLNPWSKKTATTTGWQIPDF